MTKKIWFLLLLIAGISLADANDGTYYWVMEYADDCITGAQQQKGFITVVR